MESKNPHTSRFLTTVPRAFCIGQLRGGYRIICSITHGQIHRCKNLNVPCQLAQIENCRYKILLKHTTSHQTIPMVGGDRNHSSTSSLLGKKEPSISSFPVEPRRFESNVVKLNHHLGPNDHNRLHLCPHLSSFVPFSISTLRALHYSPARRVEAEVCHSPLERTAD